ncbi:hypothetical protein Xmau_03523 [Xenorhabdus mauleonii]|uniref:Uncharacterized protein n=1 Tax=Xenorhabdus mauleonii TaxID=351675 RepID=A0A1I3WV38_9GAMM|nr:hypothetical protein Xmau_03523 [Xenorhabdus mauleonii]SFK10321.1 hypothetical protein SAMN05421680_12910 [Xenorhabdus mauleonii]
MDIYFWFVAIGACITCVCCGICFNLRALKEGYITVNSGIFPTYFCLKSEHPKRFGFLFVYFNILYLLGIIFSLIFPVWIQERIAGG